MNSAPTQPVLLAAPADLPRWALQTVNLADPRLGTTIHSCSDDFFAPAARMLAAAPAVFVPGLYDANGKWMDGWESRRRRHGGHDWCIVRLGCPGVLVGVDLDTHFFTGNYPPAASLDGCPDGANPDDPASWKPLLETTPLAGNQHHLLPLPAAQATLFSHLRLNIFPDGGIARLRVYGRAGRVTTTADDAGRIDLAALVNGARALAWNDAHFGCVTNMLLPGRGIDMGDGWETRRRREPGHDWCVIALAAVGQVARVEIDTAHFKGNYPDRVSLQAACLDAEPDDDTLAQSAHWPLLLPEQPMSADSIHRFDLPNGYGAISHVRLNLFPDGGVSRLRLWGVAKP
jgi:allantoicase